MSVTRIRREGVQGLFECGAERCVGVEVMINNERLDTNLSEIGG